MFEGYGLKGTDSSPYIKSAKISFLSVAGDRNEPLGCRYNLGLVVVFHAHVQTLVNLQARRQIEFNPVLAIQANQKIFQKRMQRNWCGISRTIIVTSKRCSVSRNLWLLPVA
jgi:hypothetical protein